jgi:hypothetical protein
VPKKLKDVIDLERIAMELERARRGSGASVGFDSTWFKELRDAVAIHAPLDDSVSEPDRLALCSEAISSVAQAGKLTEKRLRAELGKRSQALLAQPKQEFILVTALSCRHFAGLKKQRFDGWTLEFTNGCPTKFDRSHVPDHVWAQYDKRHHSFAHVTVRGKARTISEAMYAGLERLDFIRGCWNFMLNRLLWSQDGPHGARPINQLRVGPIHTVHLPSGKSAGEVWWYELLPTLDPFTIYTGGKWTKMDEQANAIRAAISETDLGPDLKKIIVRYCRALDGVDHEMVLLQLWGILETLTATGGDRYDATIARVQFLYDDEPLVGYALEMLRDRRNRTAHAGAGGSNPRVAAMQLHRFVAALLTFALQVSGRFRSLDEFGQFLAMPRDVRRLKQEIEVRRIALRFRDKGVLRGRRLVRK